MKTMAAVLWEAGKEWEVTELDLDPPREGEVLIRFTASGLCHTDEHFRHGDLVPRFPVVGGHEGAGIIEEVGPNVTRVKPGDHVVCSFIPSCGHCRYCSTGQQNLCDWGAILLEGAMPDGTFRFHGQGQDVSGTFMLGTFSQYAVVSQNSCVTIDNDIDLEVAALVGCGVPTGWGSAVYVADVRPGDTVVVYGVGGVGINAVQGARYAGARNVVAVDPVAMKREAAETLGATHSVASAAEAQELVTNLTRGQLADKSIITVDVATEQVVTDAFEVIGKGGTVVLTSVAGADQYTVRIPGFLLTLYQKTIKGSLFGGANPMYDIKKMFQLYQSGDLKLDELVTRKYRLEEIGLAYQDMYDGKNLRGLIVHDH
jgi:S-(hydroxymethyl)glutathione dehydrogenase/alcohol dehydrogenase